jgi:hypothetical protein
MMFYWSPTDVDVPTKVTFEINLPDGERLDAVKTNLKKWLAKNNYKNPVADGKVQKLAVNVDSIEDVVNLWNEFWS